MLDDLRTSLARVYGAEPTSVFVCHHRDRPWAGNDLAHMERIPRFERDPA